GSVRRFQVGVAEVVGNVVAEFAGSSFGAVERIDRLGIVVVKRAGVANDEPGESAGVFLGMMPRIGFDAGIGGGSAVLQQLLRHGTKAGGGDKGAADAADAGRNGLAFFPGLGG